MSAFLFVILFLFVAILYLIPTIVVLSNGHPYATGVVLLNIFLGWTLVGWVAALVWAVSVSPSAKPSPRKEEIVT